MGIEDKIKDALMDLQQELRDPIENVFEIVANIADDYDLKPDVLRARFERAYGDMETYGERQRALVAVSTDPMEAAMAAAEKLAARFNGRWSGFGRTFSYEGEKFVAVALSASHPKFFLRAVRVRDGREWGFNRRAYERNLAPLLRA